MSEVEKWKSGKVPPFSKTEFLVPEFTGDFQKSDFFAPEIGGRFHVVSKIVPQIWVMVFRGEDSLSQFWG